MSNSNRCAVCKTLLNFHGISHRPRLGWWARWSHCPGCGLYYEQTEVSVGYIGKKAPDPSNFRSIQ